MIGSRLRLVTGYSLLVGALGVWIDAWLSSWGLIAAYLGTIVGLVGLVVVVGRVAGRWSAVLAGVGVASTFVFWGSYPDNALFGGIGSVLIGISVLWLPAWGRVASPFWIASGTFGIPELVREGISWGPISGFTLTGAALAMTGSFVLSRAIQAGDSPSSRPTGPLENRTGDVDRAADKV